MNSVLELFVNLFMEKKTLLLNIFTSKKGIRLIYIEKVLINIIMVDSHLMIMFIHLLYVYNSVCIRMFVCVCLSVPKIRL